MCTTVGFDANFESDGTFLVELMPKIVKIYVSLTFVGSSKGFNNRFQEQ